MHNNGKEVNVSDIFTAYRMACINQYSFDSIAYIYFKENIDKFSGLPRPAKWLGDKKLNKLFRIFSKPLNFFWKFLFAYLFFFFLLLRFAISANGNYSFDNRVKNLFLGVAPRSLSVFKSILHDEKDSYCLTLSWADVSKELMGSKFNEIKLIDIINKKDVCKAYCYACKAHAIVSKDRNLSFQTYIGFYWFLVYFAICKLNPEKIYTAEHHDRWAVLLDFLALKNGMADGIIFSIVQHGLEHESTYQEMLKTRYGAGVGLPYKMKNVDVIYVYNEVQYSIFKDNIFNIYRELDVKYFKVKFSLRDIGKSLKKKILFVGHPFCYDLQIYLYFELFKKNDYEFYYKPHPTTELSKSLEGIGWSVIKEKDFFPKVDFIISYPSTLVEEYADLNINSFVHGLNEIKLNFPSILERVTKSFKF